MRRQYDVTPNNNNYGPLSGKIFSPASGANINLVQPIMPPSTVVRTALDL